MPPLDFSVRLRIRRTCPDVRQTGQLDVFPEITGDKLRSVSGETRICGDRQAVDRRADECVDQSMWGAVEELRRFAQNE